MIHTSTQLKALVRNISKGNSAKAQIIIRRYVMERFLERVALSKHRNNFVLKGGFLVSSIVGIDARSTMDIDGTIQNLNLTIPDAKSMIEEIILIPLDDNTEFAITDIGEIMEDSEYEGLRISLNAQLDTMKTPLKVDISTGDAITPKEVQYQFKLLFEDRAISVCAYNLETLLSEKLETVISRGTANTRLRDFYDLYILQITNAEPIDYDMLKRALTRTAEKRNSTHLIKAGEFILSEIRENESMQNLWDRYQRKYYYAEKISWNDLLDSIYSLFMNI